MINAKASFIGGIQDARRLESLYSYLFTQVHLSHNVIEDLLRQQIVIAVSAFDRLIHELVRLGIIESFNGTRVRTDKFKVTPFKASTVINLIHSSMPSFMPSSPDEIPSNIISKDVFERNKTLSFQAPEKVKEALSYIWPEQNKLGKLADTMSLPGGTTNDRQKYLTQRLTLIVDRRNQIAHEGDIDPSTGNRQSITLNEAKEAVDFIELLGITIFSEITNPSCYVTP